MPDLKRDNANLFMIMDEKASKMQIDGLSKELENNYPSLRVFSQLQNTVGMKAEWEDLNDTIKRLTATEEKAKANAEKLDDLYEGFNNFKESSGDEHSAIVEKNQ